jgi:phage protein U
MIGILGDIPFNVSFDGNTTEILNFLNLKQGGAANYEKHSRRRNKPSLELVDLENNKINLNITLRSDFGIEPRELLKKIDNYMNDGEILDFILGGDFIGSGEYVITSYDAGYEYISNNGKVRKIDMSLSLEEYSEEITQDIGVVIKSKNQVEQTTVKKDFNQGAVEGR